MHCCGLVSSSSFTWKKAIPPSLPTWKLLERKHQMPLCLLSTLPPLHLLCHPPRKIPAPSSRLPSASRLFFLVGTRTRTHTHTHTHTQPRRHRWWFYLKWDSARITPARFGLSVICYLIWIKLFDQSEQESPVVSVGGLKIEKSGLTPRDASQSLLSGDLKAVGW